MKGETQTIGGTAPAWARGVCDGLRALRVRHAVHVPDNPLSHILHLLAAEYADIRCTTATREEEAFAIAGGLHLGGARAVVMCQSSGIGNALNVVTSFLIPYRIPILAIVSMRGVAPEWNAAQMPMGQALPRIFDAIDVPHLTLDRADAASDLVRRAGEMAATQQLPVAVMFSSRSARL